MSQEIDAEPVLLLVISALIVLAALVKVVARRYLRVPPVVVYIALGGLLRLGDEQLHFMPQRASVHLDFLAQLGVAALLFQVGLKSNVKGLAAQLPRAVRVWVSDVVVSAGLAYLVARFAGMDMLPAAFAAAALSATSVGISVVVWEDEERLGSRLGQLLVDVAELDDLSAIMLMLTVTAVAPLVAAGGDPSSLATAAGGAGLLLLVKLAAFAALCWAFAHYAEERMTEWIARAERPPERILSIVGVAFGFAAVAGILGFSVAVGALFAGLLFSRDPRAIREEGSFTPLHALLTPFFFFDVGYALDPGAIGDAALLGLLLFVPAVLGKLLGVGLPVLAGHGPRAAAIMGVSMLPRAEIALLVARAGNRLGPWAVSDVLYGAIVCAAGLASIASPLLLQRLFQRWPQVGQESR
ncbi:MAG: cation:proton antiporter [Myxococcales bacterium]|jgi:Kef-type K+ transport system membrane component KefB